MTNFDIVLLFPSKVEDSFFQLMGCFDLRQVLKAEYYDFYIQNASTNNGFINTKIKLTMISDTDNEYNLQFLEQYKKKVLILEGINKPNGFLIIKVYLLDASRIPAYNFVPAKIRFSQEHHIEAASIPRNQGFIPQHIMDKIEKMPIPMPVKKAENYIKEWDEYLKIIEMAAYSSQVQMLYTGYRQSKSTKHCFFHFDTTNINHSSFKEFKSFDLDNFTDDHTIAKLIKLKGEYITLVCRRPTKSEVEEEEGGENFEEYQIGEIADIDIIKRIIKVDLNEEYENIFTEGKIPFTNTGIFKSSKAGDLAQAQRLRWGIKKLQFGNTCNKNLSTILFECENITGNIVGDESLADCNLLMKNLNKNQRLAVQGVLNARDYFLIQGPPGTGKTTVIAEICYQNALRGKKTLISSQSNLAVDNALSRLVHNPKIRALRKGNISRVEDDGKQYTEDKVVDTWLTKTADYCETNIEYIKKNDLLNKIIELERYLDEIYLKDIAKDDIRDRKKKIATEIKTLEKHLSECTNFEKAINQYEIQLLDKKNKITFVAETFSIFMEKQKGFVKEHVLNENLINEIKSICNSIKENSNKIEDTLLLKDDTKNKLKILQKLKKSDVSEIKSIARDNYFLSSNTKLMDKLYLVEKQFELNNLLKPLTSQEKKVRIELEKLDILSKENGIKNVYTLNGRERISRIDNNKIKLFISKSQEIHEKPIFNFWPFRKKLNPTVVKNIIKEGIFYQYVIRTEISKIKKEIKNIEDQYGKENLLEDFVADCDSIMHEIKTIENTIETDIALIEKDIKSDYVKIRELIVPILQRKLLPIKETILKLNEEIKCKNEEIATLEEYIKAYNMEVTSIFGKNYSLKFDKEQTNIKEFYSNIFKAKKTEIEQYILIVRNWITRIRQKDYGRERDLKQMYIDAVNVVGITCVQSASKDFNEQYPDFDTIIVDEVSKATPPELVLPMLKGKKIVLVGDHKQLPPMLNDQIFKELKKKQESGTCELEESDLDDMKESLFETLYRKTGAKSKVMLNIQYRMHSSIMHTINQFYIDTQNPEGLTSGVEDEQKQHGLHTGYITPDKHLLWADVPWNEKFYDQKNQSESYSNAYEIKVIKQILTDINASAGSLRVGKKVEVALITFYGEQAKLLGTLREREEEDYPNLSLRVGTVDRFQGMEREIVIASFVRNNNDRGGNIGFAHEPKRINVALSRAQNLLVIVGSSNLFCKNKGKAGGIYEKVLNIVKNNGGHISAGEILKEGSSV